MRKVDHADICTHRRCILFETILACKLGYRSDVFYCRPRLVYLLPLPGAAIPSDDAAESSVLHIMHQAIPDHVPRSCGFLAAVYWKCKMF